MLPVTHVFNCGNPPTRRLERKAFSDDSFRADGLNRCVLATGAGAALRLLNCLHAAASRLPACMRRLLNAISLIACR